jgi:DNA polymerase elongation subunit (family B)
MDFSQLWPPCKHKASFDYPFRDNALMQGIETVRRDNCLLVRKMVGKVLDHLLKERDLEKAVAHVKGVISDLLLNRIDMSDLVVSKSLSQVRCVNFFLHHGGKCLKR